MDDLARLTVVKKPIQVEAIRIHKENVSLILEWTTKKRPIVVVKEEEEVSYVEVHTDEGVMKASVGDWIIKGIEGEVYPCKNSIFNKTYNVIIRSS